MSTGHGEVTESLAVDVVGVAVQPDPMFDRVALEYQEKSVVRSARVVRLPLISQRCMAICLVFPTPSRVAFAGEACCNAVCVRRRPPLCWSRSKRVE